MRLRQLVSNKDTFRPVNFHDGMNVVIADVTEESSATDTRNGAGKTSLLQIIDFCLGGSVRDEHVLTKLADEGWEFSLTLDFGAGRCEVTREVDDPNSVRISGQLDELGIAVSEGKEPILSLRRYKDFLAAQTLGLRTKRTAYAPSFRSIFTHSFRWRSGAFVSPFEAFGREPAWQVQLNNAYLLDLDYGLASERQGLKDQASRLAKAGKEEVDEAGRKLASLDSERVLLEAQYRRLDTQLASFKVLEEYREVERRANRATRDLQRLANESTIAARQVELYEEELEDEQPVSAAQVQRLYADANIVLPELLVASLEAVEDFHRQITRNRRSYLSSEVRRINAEQDARAAEMARIEGARSTDLELLSSAGALDELSQLQARLAQTGADLRLLEERMNDLRTLRAGKAALKRAELEWLERATSDLDERRSNLGPVVERFSMFFERLYDEIGILVVDATSNGYTFDVKLPRQGSHGVSKMAILAYDLAVICRPDGAQPPLRFLAHDSPIFDGVDERQVARALTFAHEAVESSGVQYLLTVNTDDLPMEALKRAGFDLDKATVLTLTDTGDGGGLFGIRF